MHTTWPGPNWRATSTSPFEAPTASALALAREGLGVTLIPSYAAPVAREMGLKVLDVGGAEPELHELSLLTRRDAKLSLAARAFEQVLDDYLLPLNVPPSLGH